MGTRKSRAKDKPKKSKLSLVKKSNINTNKRLKQRRTAIRESLKARTGSSIPKRRDAPPKNKQSRQAKVRAAAQAAGLIPKSRKDLPFEGKDDNADDEDESLFDLDEEHETVSEEQLQYIQSMGGESFLEGIDGDGAGKPFSKKRKNQNKESALPSYERQPRIPQEGLQEQKKMKQMLPIKDARGVKKQWIERGDVEAAGTEGNKETDEDVGEAEIEQTPALPSLSTVQLFAERKKKIIKSKRDIAMLASAVIADPEKNIFKLRNLRSILEISEPDVFLTTRKLAMVSLTEVFKDIIPGYRVREWGDEDKKVMLSKDVKKKREYEEALVTNYQHFLEFLETTVKEMLTGKGKNKKERFRSKKTFEVAQVAKVSLAEVACQCLCSLLSKCAHFNFRVNVISVIVSMMFYRNPVISGYSIECMKTLFREQPVENGLVDAVTFISRKIKTRNFKVHPKVLNTFLSLRIKETNLRKEEESLEAKKAKMLQRKNKMNKMTRSQKRYQKQIEVIQKEQKVAEAAIGDTKKLKLNTEIIQSVFATYFRVLKTASDSTLLPSVLEGLAKFAHLINIEFFDDLVKVLNELIASGTLEYRESLHCVLTAFNVLSGQGDILNIDPNRFYTHLYTNLLMVHAGCSSMDAVIIIRCLDAMIFKRHKQITVQRVMAYLKRLGALSLQSLPNASLAFLCAMRNIMKLYPKTDILLDRESLGSGIFLPELEEPEHCHAQNTALWELHLLKRHFHPIVKPYALNIIKHIPIKGIGALDITLSRKRPIDLFEEYDSSAMTFNPPILTKPAQNIRKGKYNLAIGQFLQPDFGSAVNSRVECTDESASALDFYAHLTRKRRKTASDEKVTENGDSNVNDKDVMEKDGADNKKTVAIKHTKAGQFAKLARGRRRWRTSKAKVKHFGSLANQHQVQSVRATSNFLVTQIDQSLD